MKFLVIFLLTISTCFAREIILTETNTVNLSGPVTPSSIGEVMYELSTVSETGEPTDPIYLVLNTPGGSVGAGLKLIEYMNTLRRPVTVIANYAASMGFHILQHSEKRLVTPFSTIMSHRANGGVSGDIPHQLSNRLKHVTDILTKMDDHIVSRTKGKQTQKSYMELIRDEYYSVGENSIKDGFADEVVTLKCDSSLNRYVSKTISMMFFTVSVKMSKCPLASLPIVEEKEDQEKIHRYFNEVRQMEL
jgi:ATP-dependent Clp protease protease subunit